MKLRVIGQEPKKFNKWGYPFLGITLDMVKYGNRYSGFIEITFHKEATFVKQNLGTYAVAWGIGKILN